MNELEMPEALRHYWAMWNETDIGLIRRHLDQAVSEDFLFVDPLHYHVGRDALEANVTNLRSEHPEYFFTMASDIDHHHDRYRYIWLMSKRDQVLIEGFDVATFNEAGLIERVDGFFGPLVRTDSA